MLKSYFPAIAILALLATGLTACSTGDTSNALPSPPSPIAAASPVVPTTQPTAPKPVSTQPSGGEQTGTAQVDSIQIMMLESFPVQVRVVVKGSLPDSCTSVGTITQERQGDIFNVSISTTRPGGAMCAQMIVPFEQTVALDARGLKAGTYKIIVNNVTETFDLKTDNVLP